MGTLAATDRRRWVAEKIYEKINHYNYSDYTGFWGGLRYPPKEAEMQRLCSQLS